MSLSSAGICARETPPFTSLLPLDGADFGIESSAVNLSAMTSTIVRVLPSRPVYVRLV
jgi:hypothetical protein